ncbi:MAG: hypothetical protein IJO57_00665 [Bacilli bacterium]|nr:hypothetical protein [Bacilli bacterium]
MKKIIIIVLSFILLLGISYFIFFFNHSKSEEIVDNKEVEINNVDEKNEISGSLDKNDEVEQEVVLDNKEEDNKSNNKEHKEESINTDTKKDTVTNNVPKVENKKESTVMEEKKEEVIVDEVVVEEVKEITAWEELGITEHDYYNKPMWSWARIDFSIKDYKTYEKTREACITKGEEYFKQGLGYSCTSINSYSGEYLGEMIKTF